MLGYGAMELRGAPRARDISDRQAETILRAVLDAGINYIDTSIDYGLSGERIGRYIAAIKAFDWLGTVRYGLMDDLRSRAKTARGNCSGGTNGLDPNYNNTGSPLRGWFRLPPVGIWWRHRYRRYSAHHTYRLFVVRTRGIVIFRIHSRHT